MDRYHALGRALNRNASKSVRAEDLADFDDFFVDPIGIDDLTGNSSQVIFGRRGSGKTILLGALHERICALSEERRIASFYYTADDFRSSAEFQSSTPTVKQEALAYFNTFLCDLSGDILQFAQKRLFDNARWTDAFTRQGAKANSRRTALLNKLIELEEVARYGIESPMPLAFSSSVALTHGHARTKATGFGVGGTVGAKAGASALPSS